MEMWVKELSNFANGYVGERCWQFYQMDSLL